MVICCAAPNCTNRQGKGKRRAISFHRFPLKDSARLFLWTAAIQRSDWTPGPYSFLCSEHFSDDSFVPRMPDQHPLLRPDAVPSLFKDGMEIKRSRALGPHVFRLGKRKHLKKKFSPFSLEDKRLLVPTAEGFVDKSDTSANPNRNEATDAGHHLHPCGQHTTSKFIFSLHSYSRSSATSLSQDVEEGAKHVQDLHPKEHLGLSPSLEHGSGDVLCSVEGSKGTLGCGSTALASGGQDPLKESVTNSEVLESHVYAVQEPIPGVQIKCLPQDRDSEIMGTLDSLHSYCSTAMSQPSRTKQCSNEELTAKSGGEELCSGQLDCKAQGERNRIRVQKSCSKTAGAPDLNPVVAPLAWMLGTWVSDPPGEGEFPSIPSFHYIEEVVISHVGQPMLNFTFCSSNPETRKPMHRECGFIRVKPGTNQVAFICAQNIGVVEVEEGEVSGEQLTLTSQSLSRMSFARAPHVQQISRTFRLTTEGKLEQTVSMATSTQAMAPHLRVTYKKVTS
ncbi:peroxynitrite isomerase THAP4 isoform X2 [Eleutherodactylus coqui]|uniref:peroxynitrite isomerase THAP4 isoform X2 n=1 Tax=Eleutherodactylus coqui TaxID=57060 RepID=UPI003461C81B